MSHTIAENDDNEALRIHYDSDWGGAVHVVWFPIKFPELTKRAWVNGYQLLNGRWIAEIPDGEEENHDMPDPVKGRAIALSVARYMADRFESLAGDVWLPEVNDE